MRRDVVVEVNGKRFEVSAWVPEAGGGTPGLGAAGPNSLASPAAAARARRHRGPGSSASGNGQVTVPMQGTIVKVLVEVGQEVAAGDGVVVLEAMKMENSINADCAGTVTEIKVASGDTVGAGDVVAVIG